MKSVPTSLTVMVVTLILAGLSMPEPGYARLRMQNVVGMWLFDEIIESGPVKIVRDSSDRGHDGLVMGNPDLEGHPHLVEGKIGKAMMFGNGKYVKVADHKDLRIHDVLSISVWVKRPMPKVAKDLKSAPFYIVEKGGFWGHNQLGMTNYGLAIHKILDNMVYFFYKGGLRGAKGIPDDNWHHYVAVVKNGIEHVTIYVDGERRPDSVTNGQGRVSLFTSNRSLHIGALMPERFDSYSETIIDELIIFKTALSSGDVDQLRGGFFAVSPSDKIASTWAQIKQER